MVCNFSISKGNKEEVDLGGYRTGVPGGDSQQTKLGVLRP